MIIQCKSCSRKFIVKDSDIPKEGRSVQCGYCSVTWYQMPQSPAPKNDKKVGANPIQDTKISKVKNKQYKKILKASDGKKYKYLGNQWAVLLPSGKTGIFAKKIISKELDKIVGIKRDNSKKINEINEVNPLSGNLSNNTQLPDVYKPKEGLGFFSYIFIILIIILSLVGVLKTFEEYLVNLFPQAEFIYELLEQQINYFSETTRNMIIIINDLINSY